MKLWLTAQEIADAKLPGLPAVKRPLNALIDRERWRDSSLARCQKRRGGPIWTYHIDLLPLPARLAYARRHLLLDQADFEFETPAEDDGAALTARLQGDARLAVLRICDRFRAKSDLSVTAGDHLFSELFNSASIDLPDWVRTAVKRISPRTLANWRSRVKSGDADKLAVDRAAARKGSGVLDRAHGGEVKTLILAAIAKNQFLFAHHVRALVRDRYGDELEMVCSHTGEITSVKLPPLRTFQDAIRRWKVEHKTELLKLTDPDGFKSKARYVATGSTKADRLNEVWEIDASPADVMLVDGRYSFYSCTDIFSRRKIALASKTPRADAVALLLRKALIAWGVPEIIRTDRGSDFTAHSTGRLMAALGIEADICPANSPERKGVVERAIRTFQHSLCRTLPGFIGHSVADRKVIEGRKAFSQRLGLDDADLFNVELTLPEFEDYADRWCEAVYAHNKHGGLRGVTPFEKAASYTGKVRRIENEDALNLLLAPIAGKDGYRQMTKSGVRVDGYHYLPHCPVLPGTRVFCRHDPADLGRLHVFADDGESFIGHAICAELAGLDPAEVVAKARAMQKALIDETVKPLRRVARSIGTRDVVEAILRGAEKDHADLLAFPRPIEAHETPAIRAAAAAVSDTEPAPTPMDARAAELHAEIRRDLEGTPATTPANVQALPETREQRFRRALDLERRIAAGDLVDPKKALWLGGYQAGPEYRALKLMREGAEALG